MDISRLVGRGVLVVATAVCCLQWESSVYAQEPSRGMPAWRTVTTPDSQVQLQLPPSYREQGARGCWARDENSGGGSTYRHLCVFVADSVRASMEHFVVPPNCLDDCPRIADRVLYAIDIGGRRTTVETARVGGGVQGAERVLRLIVAMPIGDEKTVILDGTPGDAAGDRELVTIARTMRVVARSP
jgi:hypothetical protein